MFLALPVLAILLALTPALAAPKAPPLASEHPQASYSQAEAEADLTTLLTARGREYLDARARLEAAPRVVAPLVASRLDRGAPALGPAERQRLLALLGTFARPEDLLAFADQLRRDVKAASRGQRIDAAAPWRLLLHQQGPAAAGILAELAADRELDESVRALLLADLIAILPAEGLTSFIAMIGEGPTILRQALRQALLRRGRERPDERPELIAAIDQRLTNAPTAHLSALLGLRAAIGEIDPVFLDRLLQFSEDPRAPFVVRVAALRLLAAGAASNATIREKLAQLVTANLKAPRSGGQAAEILGWIALQTLPTAEASILVAELDLLSADEPRIAAAAFAVAPLTSDGAWLPAALENPWPEVRRAALARVRAPCPQGVIRQLASIAAPPEKRGDLDEGVAREALRALGRCASADAESALIRVLKTKIAEPLRRSEAAKQILIIGEARGDAAVAKAIETLGDPSLVRRLVEAAQVSKQPTPALIRALCQVSADFPALRSSVAETLRTIAPGSTCSQT